MGKAAKKRRKDARKTEKAKRKAAKAALYKSYAEKGRENKSRKFGGRTTSKGKGLHLMADCGNVGCLRCYPWLNNWKKQNGKFRDERPGIPQRV